VCAAVPKFLAGRRRTQFADQLADTLQLLGSSLRAGYGLVQAVDAVAKEAPSPTDAEFRRVVVESRLGRDLSASLWAAARRLEVVDFDWVVQAIEIHREVGGDLAEVLDNVGATIRDRNQLRRQVKALTAEGRYSAYVLLALPFVLALLMKVINPEYMGDLFKGFGLVLVGFGGVLMVTGTVWLRKLCRPIF
jgi:tight adherence protein B